MSLAALRRELELREQLNRIRAKEQLLPFIIHCNKLYQANWHHKVICEKVQNFWLDPDKKRLMLFVPPQHGKSEIASRYFPAWVLGVNRDTKIAALSYSIDLARSFNRDIQRIIETKEYRDIFPNTYLNSKNVASDSKTNWLRNTEEFEVVESRGSYKAVGVMGGLSGRPVDLAIIDDPVKDAMEASSPVYRNRVWEWYTNVLETRLHNESKVMLIMTRWHEDDLAGRLLMKQGEKWDLIKIPAIQDGTSFMDDPRQLNEPLWPEKHSYEKLMNIKSLSETTFNSLYQQNPSNPEGEIIKKEWFQFINENQLPYINWDMWIDGAYTKSTKNDPSGIMIAGEHSGNLYIKFATSKYMEMPEILKIVPELADLHGLANKSRVYFEPKASGKSMKQMINKNTDLSAVEITGSLVNEGKEARIQVAAPKVESGKVFLVNGSWIDSFISQICAFPNAAHDEYVDLIGYACDKYFQKKKFKVKRRN